MVSQKKYNDEAEYLSALESEILYESELLAEGKEMPESDHKNSTVEAFNSEILSESESLMILSNGIISLSDSVVEDKVVEDKIDETVTESESISVDFLDDEQRALSEFAYQILHENLFDIE